MIELIIWQYRYNANIIGIRLAPETFEMLAENWAMETMTGTTFTIEKRFFGLIKRKRFTTISPPPEICYKMEQTILEQQALPILGSLVPVVIDFNIPQGKFEWIKK